MGVNLTGGTRFSPRIGETGMVHGWRDTRVEVRMDPRPQIKAPGIAVQAAWTVHHRDRSFCLYASVPSLRHGDSDLAQHRAVM